MSFKKLEAMIDDMVFKAPWEPKFYGMAKNIGAIMKMIYSEVLSLQKELAVKKEKKSNFSRIARKNLGKRIREPMHTFKYPARTVITPRF